ncbi:hypothetical protein [Umezawaea beigongshangensis]|uniref:hypothetical protein n=1 Tax=Umezawaea beigongshangensis TaxID=2780383 RepID=UPI0018F24A4E|nr:hypothetical protein [Umezawaea beigongshangensis]
MTDTSTGRRAQLVLLLGTHAMTDEQAREHENPLIRLQARMTPQTPEMADVWLLNRMTVRHRELGWRGAPPTYGDLLDHRAGLAEREEREPGDEASLVTGAHRRDRVGAPAPLSRSRASVVNRSPH